MPMVNCQDYNSGIFQYFICFRVISSVIHYNPQRNRFLINCSHSRGLFRVQVGSRVMALTMSTSIDLFLYGLLFVLFMVFFGIPSIEQYRKKETIFITSEKMTNGIDAPAISLIAVDNNIGYGFRTETNQTNSTTAKITGNFLWDHCQEINQIDLEDCISSDSYELTDFVKTAMIDFPIRKNFGKLNKSLWHEDIGPASQGRVYTWNPQRIITRNWTELIFLSLK